MQRLRDASRLTDLPAAPARRAPPWPTIATLAVLALSATGCEVPGADGEAPRADGPDRIRVDVQVVSPRRRDIVRRIELPVSVDALEATTLLSKVSGYLSRIEVDIGDRVRRDQVIAEVEVPEMVDQLAEAEAQLEAGRADRVSAEAELDSARARLEIRQVTHDRVRAVREDDPDLIPLQTVDEARAEFRLARAAVKAGEGRIRQVESKIKQAEAAIQRLRTLIGYAEIRAPFDGIVTKRHVHPGTLLQAAISSQDVQPIVTVASMDRVRLRTDVPESEVPFLQVGDLAEVTVDSMPGRVFRGTVTRFAGALDPATRTMRTEIEMANPKLLLRPGMYGRAALTLDTRTDAITIPSDAVRVDGDTTYVYCVVNGSVRRRDVEAAVGDGASVEVTAGLEGSESVVVSARGQIADGVAVNASPLGPE